MSERSFINNRALVEGALLISLTVILYLVNMAVGLLIWTIPIPLAIYCFRHGTKLTVLCCLTASLVTGMLLGPVQGTTLLLTASLVSIICGIVLREKHSDIKATSLVAIAFMFSLIMNFGMTAVITNTSPSSFIEEAVSIFKESGEMLENQYRAIGIDEASIAEFSERIDRTLQFLENAFWSILLIFCILMGVLILNLTRAILIRMKIDIRKAVPFSQWKVRWDFIWVLIFGVAVYVIGNGIESSIATIIGINIMVFAFAIYLAGGVALLTYIFDKRRFPTVALVLSLIVIWMFGLYYFLAVIAIADGWLDFRKRIADENAK